MVNLYNEGRLLPNMISPELYRSVVYAADDLRRFDARGRNQWYQPRTWQNFNMPSFDFPYWNRYGGNFANLFNVYNGPFNTRAFNTESNRFMLNNLLEGLME